MTSSAANWRLDTLSASARATAEIAALGAGMSLSAWLTRLITETCARDAAELEPVDGAAAAPESHADATEFRILPAPAAAAEPLLSSEALSAGAQMVAVAAMAPADLGTRRSEDVPEALFADIAKRGVRQPLLVRSLPDAPERFAIVCGHRRWRAAQRAGLARVPATIFAEDDAHAILASLGENLTLGDLSPIDEAHAYLRLLTRCSSDAGTIARAIGRDRRHIVRTMRLLGLSARLQELVGNGTLSAEHAELLLDAANPETLADMILGEHLSPEAARQRAESAPSLELRA
ncbi:MAG TPA: ParB/RepB/Spo0J family partition protein [Stellaceae bacterium]|nr:ParB/RepB/Spo0J family partition protein [Stellaceae bacterium]